MKRITTILSFFIFLLLGSSKAQIGKHIEVYLKDSLMATGAERFLYHSLAIKNTSSKPVLLKIKYAAPTGWRTLPDSNSITVEPNDQQMLALTLLPQPEALAQWQPLKIIIIEGETNQTSIYTVQLKAKANQLFGGLNYIPEVFLQKSDKAFQVKSFFKNYGNVPVQIRINYYCQLLNLNQIIQVTLQPGKDTVISKQISVSAEVFEKLTKDEIFIRATDSIATLLMTTKVKKLVSSLKMNKSPYPIIASEIETGYLRLGKQATYFFGLSGGVELKNKGTLRYNYRSKEFGQRNQMQRNIFDLEYNSQYLNLAIGQIRGNHFFISDGTGFVASYLTRKGVRLDGTGSWHNSNSFFKSDLYGLGVSYEKKKVKFRHELSYAKNILDKETGTVFMNIVKFKKNDKLTIEGKAGVGTEEIRGNKSARQGTAVGYTVHYSGKLLQLHSSYLYHNDYFPGINRGLQNQNHSFLWQGKVWSAGAFYQSNRTLNVLLRDTIYNISGLSINLKKYGLMTSFSRKKIGLNTEAGRFIQTGSNSNNLANYSYGNIGLFYKPFKDFHFQVSNLSGTGFLEGDRAQGRLWIHNLNSSFQYRFLGVSGFYVGMPVIEQDTSNIRKLMYYDKTLSVTPYVGITLLKKVNANFNYTVSKSLYDSAITHFAGLRLNYLNIRKGINSGFIANIPITKSKAPLRGMRDPYFSISLIKKINIPLITKRKYHTLKVSAFTDLNGDGIRNAGEEKIRKLHLNINQTPFLSDPKGDIYYKNIPPGNYQFDLNDAMNIPGFVPSGGALQEVKLERGKELNIPFKRSKMIAGKVLVKLDSLNHSSFSPAGLKVFAYDSTGQYFSTLVDANGQFYINVPSGVYHVSLNPKAFDEKMHPQVMSFKVNLLENENARVEFTIVEQKRKIRILSN